MGKGASGMAREIIKVRNYKAGYQVRTECFTGEEHGVPEGESFEMKSAYTPSGSYIGRPKDAHYIVATRGIKPELRTDTSQVCSIGFCEREQKWYGWSHRALSGFGIGDPYFHGWANPNDIESLEFKRGEPIATLDEARQSAANFAECVS